MLRLSPPEPFAPAFVLAMPHGIAAGVHLPGTADPVPEDVLARLAPEERALAEGMRGYRQPEFVGGRLALAAIFPELGLRRVPVLVDAHGAPELPGGVAGSVTHKRDLAIAMVARGSPGLGIDLEETDRERPGVASHVLRAEELAAVEALPADRRWNDTAVRFSVKEAVYKAIHPFLLRYVGFGEVAVWPSPDGFDRVEPHLAPGEGPFHFDARHYWIDRRVFSTVRVRKA
ncbi:MAG: 4'-phosphopantetheinyl transferase family protein [Myxococcota bacterium]